MPVKIYVPPILTTVVVTGDLVIEDDLDTLEMYFDNEIISGGGGVVEKATTVDEATGAIHITFEEEKGSSIISFMVPPFWQGRLISSCLSVRMSRRLFPNSSVVSNSNVSVLEPYNFLLILNSFLYCAPVYFVAHSL